MAAGSTRGVQVIAHRGARGCAPENTLAAIELAAAQGADAVEIDVQLSRDGVPVVVHDDTLVRTTDARERFPDRAPWWVSDFDLAELRLLDAGTWFVDELALLAAKRQPFLRSLDDAARDRWIDAATLARYASGDVRIPTLAECIAHCAHLELAMHVELKAIPRFPASLVERVLDTIATVSRASPASARPSLTVSSFDHRSLARIRSLDPTRRTAALVRDRLADPVAYLRALGAVAYHPGCQGDDDTIGSQSVDGALDTTTIAALRVAGFEVNVWTENDPARMRRLVDAGVTGIFTDYPDRLRDLVDGTSARVESAATTARSTPVEDDDERLRLIESRLHALIRSRVLALVGDLPIDFPRLHRHQLDDGRPQWLPVDGMYGGFRYRLEGTHRAPVLRVESWSRIVGYSGQAHVVLPDATLLVRVGF